MNATSRPVSAQVPLRVVLVGGSGFLGSAVRSRLVDEGHSVQPVIEMGARRYHPVLCRFLETDPVESGVDNDSTYPADPVNHDDLWNEIANAASRSRSSVNEMFGLDP